MAYRPQLLVTTAPSGAGKTYVRCARFLVNEFLPLEQGVSWSNFPLEREPFYKHFKGKMTEEELDRRLRQIPEEELENWRNGFSGPWDYFQDKDLKGAHIQLDEAHRYVKKDKESLANWAEWLGAVRHAGGTVELITQAPSKLHKDVRDEAEGKIILIDSQGIVDPYFKIQMADWYEMKAMMTGRYVSYFVEVRFKRYDEKFKREKSVYHARIPKYFAFYNSYNEVGKVKGSKAQKQEFQKRSFFSLLWWFYIRNCFTLTIRSSIAAAVILLLVYLPTITNTVLMKARAYQKAAVKKNDRPALPKSNGIDQHGNPDYWPKPELDPEKVKLLQAELIEKNRVINQQASDYHKLNAIHQTMMTQIIKAKQANDLIGMLFQDKAVTVSGRTVTVGDILQTFDGEKTIKGFNYERSQIEFTDATSAWVTIGQRRVQDAANVPEIPTDAETSRGAFRANPRTTKRGSGGPTSTHHLPSGRATSLQRNQRDSSTVGRDSDRDTRPTIYSRYVGPQQTAGGSGDLRTSTLSRNGTNPAR